MPSKDIYTELNAFMGKMHDGETREMVANLQAAIEYQGEKLRIYEKKYMEATGMAWHPTRVGLPTANRQQADV